MVINKKEAEEKFDDFLMIMDDQLEWLSGEAKRYNVTLGLKTEDFAKLEKLFDLMSEGQTKDFISKLVVIFARYLGEIVRINYGGKWILSLDDENNVNFNTPVIVGHTTMKKLEFAPISVMRAYSLRRKQRTLQSAVDAQINPKPLDLSDLIEE